MKRLLGFQDHRFVLVSAPAGYGKTALMGKCYAYARTHKEQAAWLSLEEADNDSARLRRSLRAALEHAFGEERPDEPWALPAATDESCTLYIDDLHVLNPNAVADLYELLIEDLPPMLRFVLGSRNANLPQFSALRNKRKLVEIDRAELAFSRVESGTYLQAQLGNNATDVLVDSLHGRTEGWPAALQFACASLRQRGFGSKTSIVDVLPDLPGMATFLNDELIESQSQDIQEFLLAVAMLNQFAAPLIEHLRPSGDAETLIEKLFDAGIPIRQRDRGWYQLHPLLGSHLRSVAKQRNATRFSADGRLAAEWLTGNGRTGDAVDALLATGNLAEAARLLEKLARSLLAHARYAAAIRWCEFLPVKTVQSNAVLCCMYAVCLALCNHREKAAVWFTRCSEQAKKRDADPMYAGTVHLLEMFELVSRGTSEQLEGAIPVLEEAALATTQFERGSFANLLAYAHLAGADYVAAEKSILISKRIFREEKRFFGLANTHYMEAIAAAAQGRIREAINYLEAISLLAEDNQHQMPLYRLHAMSGGFLAALYYEMNDIDQATVWLGHDRFAEGQSTSSDSMLCATLSGFRVALLQDRLPEAFALMETRLALAKDCGFPRVAQAIELELARYAVMSHQPEKAEAYRTQLLEYSNASSVPHYIRPSEDTEGAGVAQARLMLHLGLLSEGGALIEKLLADAISHRRKWREAKLRILKAVAMHNQGLAAEEAQEIAAALELGASMGLVRTFLDEGDVFMARLRTHAEAIPRSSQNSPTARYLASLLHAADAQALARRPLAAASFSEQESKLLDLLARGRTNRDIAAALELSVNTVKWHLAHIYAKLRVHNRSQAVFIARQRGLMN